MARHRPTLALSQEVDFPRESGMRSTPAGAQRRELSKSVEFLKIGSLDRMLWLRDADRVHRVPCYIRRNKSKGKATGPPPELLTLGLARNTPEEALE